MKRTTAEREEMVTLHIARRGVTDAVVLAAFRAVPREAFLPEELRELAYADMPLPIGHGQTISQPYIVALMVSALGIELEDRVLEIGTGSGYSAAILAQLAGEVYTIERHADLVDLARRHLSDLGVENVTVRHADGSVGWPEHAPYDAIVVTAAGPSVPPALLEQLVPGGRIVMPVGEGRGLQKLVRMTRHADGSLVAENLCEVCFVPLIGAQGFDEASEASKGEGAPSDPFAS